MTNRIIKFRAWDIKDKRMIDLRDCLIDAYGIIMFKEIMDGKHLESYLPLQFTGLIDKNGKEIYEGDVVKNNDLIWSVQFEEGSFTIKHDDAKGTRKKGWHIMGEGLYCEIIGNIHENPDLIR